MKVHHCERATLTFNGKVLEDVGDVTIAQHAAKRLMFLRVVDNVDGSASATAEDVRCDRCRHWDEEPESEGSDERMIPETPMVLRRQSEAAERKDEIARLEAENTRLRAELAKTKKERDEALKRATALSKEVTALKRKR